MSDVDVETGTYWEGSGQSSVAYTFATVAVTDLPHGLRIDSQLPGLSTGGRVSVSCDEGRDRTVTVDSVPVHLDGLRLEQVSVDLEEFLTPERKSAICSMRSRLNWIADGHQIEQRLPKNPYPKKRVLAAALSGDPQAIQTVQEHRDQVVALVEGAFSDSETAVRELRVSFL